MYIYISYYITYIKHISNIYQQYIKIYDYPVCVFSLCILEIILALVRFQVKIRNQWYLTSNLDKFLDIFPLNQSNHRGITSLVMAITGQSLRLGPEGHGTRQDFSGFMPSIRTRGRANFPPKAAPEFIRQTSTN